METIIRDLHRQNLHYRNNLWKGFLQVCGRFCSRSSQQSKSFFTNDAAVALESTVITHGMPFPENLRAAISLEKIVRQESARPATIAVLDGNIKIGLTNNELSRLAQLKDVRKVSRRDLSFVASKKLHGGTTVSATMLLAHQAGIPVFATGGIGGVHRDGQNNMDISADLVELGRTPVAVVCAGVKSILDIGRTLEYLETQGVCVATIGSTNDFPSFFSRKSGFLSPCHVKNETEAAELIYSHQQLNLQSGILLAAPVPEEHEIPLEKVEDWLYNALLECSSQKITGKDITPFLLKHLVRISGGQTLKTNIALLENNARIAARIAVQLKKMTDGLQSATRGTNRAQNFRNVEEEIPLASTLTEIPGPGEKPVRVCTGQPVVIGGTVLDIIAKSSSELKMNGSTHAGEINFSSGGVGRNIADCLSRLGVTSVFLSAVGDDYNGQFIRHSCSHMNLSKLLICPDRPTSCYVGILAPSGQLLGGLMNMSTHGMISPDYILQHKQLIQDAPLLLLDGNLSLEALDCALDLAGGYNVPVFYEPTDINKAAKPFATAHGKEITFLSPNVKELQMIMTSFGMDQNIQAALTAIATQSIPLIGEPFQRLFDQLPRLQVLLVKLGKQGSLLVSRGTLDLPVKYAQSSTSVLHARHYKAPPVHNSEIVSVSGGGDCMVAGFISGILRGYTLAQSVAVGTASAALSLKSNVSVPKSVTPTIFQDTTSWKTSAVNPT